MIRILVLFILACALLAGGAVLVEEKGYVLIHVAGWSWEASFIGFLFIILVAYLVFKLIEKVLISLFSVRRSFSNWRKNRKQSTSLHALQQSIEALLSGQWQKAEQLSLKHAKYSPIASSHYLIAAEAAKNCGQHEESSLYLLRAQENGDESHKQLAMAQSLQQEGKTDKAIELTEKLYRENKKNTQTLLLLARLYETSEDFEKLRELLPDVKRYAEITDSELQLLALKAWQPIFTQAALDNSERTIEQAYKQLTKLVGTSGNARQNYFSALLAAGCHSTVEKKLIKLFDEDTHKNQTTINILKTLELNQPLKLIAWLEKKLKSNPQDDWLKIALAITAAKNRDWQLAQQAMESAIRQLPSAENYAILGDIYQENQQSEKAKQCYRKGLSLLLDAA
ncbi:heme biosynthesis HemY N-terminal domain-containing protein [Catenovulum sediminis]|uniref:Heme biosynthesis HemY N-terminal domain-containing protein n=1 Tax=Catenovulum sediminis TaxID=1740262 RepID=A0ABV1RIL5_9ALTE|nr:heme biosynthesis HemY N-terminal domain-containing protein [Catenovulum sediminis]